MWVKNCLYQLTCDERHILMSEDEWLTDVFLLVVTKVFFEGELYYPNTP